MRDSWGGFVVLMIGDMAIMIGAGFLDRLAPIGQTHHTQAKIGSFCQLHIGPVAVEWGYQ